MRPDEQLVRQVDRLGATPWTGVAYRYTAAPRDPLSGTGARLFGGRWNPKDAFGTVYLATPLAACLAELERAAQAQQLTVPDLLTIPYRLHTIAVTGLNLLDLRRPAALRAVGLTRADLADPDWTACQAVGHAAWLQGLSGLIAPSATGAGDVIALFENRMGTAVTVESSEPLTPTRYAELRAAEDSP